MNTLLVGAAASAVGTVALDATSYTDMLLRGRGASAMTQTVAQKLAERVGIDALSSPEPNEPTKNRQTAAGSLLGPLSGIAVGIVYGAVRPLLRGRVPVVVAGLLAGAASMALTDVTATMLEATDPKEWDLAGWLSDIIPHAVFGIATALAFEALAPAPAND